MHVVTFFFGGVCRVRNITNMIGKEGDGNLTLYGNECERMDKETMSTSKCQPVK